MRSFGSGFFCPWRRRNEKRTQACLSFFQWVEGARSPGLHGPTTATVRCGLSRRGAIILMVFLVKSIFSSQAPKVTEGLMG